MFVPLTVTVPLLICVYAILVTMVLVAKTLTALGNTKTKLTFVHMENVKRPMCVNVQHGNPQQIALHINVTISTKQILTYVKDEESVYPTTIVNVIQVLKGSNVSYGSVSIILDLTLMIVNSFCLVFHLIQVAAPKEGV
jgi:hypothetical protein